jgi:starch synthase
VAGALPKALRLLGHDVRLIMPRYRRMTLGAHEVRPSVGGASFAVSGSDESARLGETTSGDVPVYLVENDGYFGRDQIYGYADDTERFLYFSRAALAALEPLDWTPDVVHCNDWHTAIIPRWMRVDTGLPEAARSAASILTIHNLAFQGPFDPSEQNPAWIDPAHLYAQGDGWYSLLAQGIASANLVTTVSERYAEEITTPEYGEGLDGLLTRRQNSLRGILNGIDYDVFDPATDPAIPDHFTADDLDGKEGCKLALQQEAGFDVGPRRPLIGFVGRLFDQKGFDLILEVLEQLLAEVDVQVVVLGTGEPEYEETLRRLSSRNRRQLAAYLRFDADLAQRIYAAADIFLMPSRYEPCGLGQMIALRYGTVPVVRATGGLVDTVLDYQGATGRGTGFVFKRYDAIGLVVALSRALELYRQPERWREIQRQGMRQDFSWTASAQRYVEAYQDALVARRGDGPRAD